MGEYSAPKHFSCAAVKIESGLLSGTQLPNYTRTFLGVPYAAPPVNDLRWRPPQRLQPWTGIRKAENFGPSSLQYSPPTTSIYHGGESELSEDCLYMNIYTGPDNSNDRPVLVWFHFGAFSFGSASNPLYDGTNLAAKGVTVVTVNYRLGRFGFLAHPELSAESGYQGSGNYGIMDQIAALEWVQRNIKSFGGDPHNVTIGGASAGGASTHILRCSPLARSLFTRIICESGSGLAPVVDGPGHLAAYSTLAAAEEAGTELTTILKVSSINELRRIPAAKILTALLPRAKGSWKTDLWPGSVSLSMFDTANPIIDGHVLPESPLTALLSGNAADVPMLVGNVGNEAQILPYLDSLADYHEYVNDTFGDLAQDVLRLYPAIADEEVRDSSSQILADQTFLYPTWTSARLSVMNLRSPVWYYMHLRAPRLPRSLAVSGKRPRGAFNVSGVPYGFDNLDKWKPNWKWTKVDTELAKEMSDCWVRFVSTGNPNSTDIENETEEEYHEDEAMYHDDEEADDHGSYDGDYDVARLSEEHQVNRSIGDGSHQPKSEAWPAVESSEGLIQIWDSESRLETPGPRASEMTAFWDRYYNLQGQITI